MLVSRLLLSTADLQLLNKPEFKSSSFLYYAVAFANTRDE